MAIVNLNLNWKISVFCAHLAVDYKEKHFWNRPQALAWKKYLDKLFQHWQKRTRSHALYLENERKTERERERERERREMVTSATEETLLQQQ